MSVDLDALIAKAAGLPEDQRAAVEKLALERRFIPSPGPQTDAYFSKADLLLYGGAGGGGKSALIAGLALEEHIRTLIIRRNYSDLEKGGALIDEVLKFYGSRDGFRGGNQAKLSFDDGKVITFGGVTNLGDEQKFQGQPRDLLAIDEATQLLEAQVRFLMGWVRSEVEGQRRRTILATNPPTDSNGDWINGMFRPWLDLTHPNPAQPGELRWYVTDPDGNDMEVDGPEPHQFPGQSRAVLPQSRSFIPAFLDDNPFLLHDDGYRATQDSLPEPLRSAIRDGNFAVARQDDEWQVIPTMWVLEAQERWTAEKPEHAPMCALGVDVAQGGADQTVLAPRYDAWFDELLAIPGRETPDGPTVAGHVIVHRRNDAVVVIDMGGGYGGSAYDHLKQTLKPEVLRKYLGSEGTGKRSLEGNLAFTNTRSMAYWRMREALNPGQDGGSPVALPPDPELRADLTAPRFDTRTGKIKVESKEDLVKRLGRSTDRGDAVVMANLHGPKVKTHGSQWRKYSAENGGRGGRPVKVSVSRPQARRR